MATNTNNNGSTNMSRSQAERNYRNALAAARRAEDVSEQAYAAASATLDAARRGLAAAELAEPTAAERRRSDRRHYMHSIGLGD